MRKKRILYAALKYSYAKPSLGLSFEYYNFLDSLRQIRNLEVEEFDWVSIRRDIGKARMNELLLQQVDKFNPDLVFFSIFREEFSKEVIREISSRTLTFNWFSDDIWRFDSYAKNWALYFSWISSLDGQVLPKYKAIGYDRVIITQSASNPRMYQKLKLEKKWPVSFIGQTHSNRKRMITELKRRNIEVEIWGRGWKNGVTSFRKMVRIFNQSKINLNFTNTSFSFQFGRFLPWFFQPLTLVGENPTTIMNGRMFEVPTCGGFLLTQPTENLKKYFEEGKEVITFENFEDLVDKVGYYLQHERAREKVAKAGYERARKEHTYERRFKEIFKKIGI